MCARWLLQSERTGSAVCRLLRWGAKKPQPLSPNSVPWMSSPESVPFVSTVFGRRQLLRIVNSSQEGGVLGTLVSNGCLLRKVQVPLQSAE